jgi:nitrate reductase gamma subunit
VPRRRTEDSESGLLSRGSVDSSASSGRTFQIHIIHVYLFFFYFFRTRIIASGMSDSERSEFRGDLHPDIVRRREIRSPKYSPSLNQRENVLTQRFFFFFFFNISLTFVIPRSVSDHTGCIMKRYHRHQVYIVLLGSLLFLHVSTLFINRIFIDIFHEFSRRLENAYCIISLFLNIHCLTVYNNNYTHITQFTKKYVMILGIHNCIE